MIGREVGRGKKDRLLGMIGSLGRGVEEECEVGVVVGLGNMKVGVGVGWEVLGEGIV